MSTAWGYITLLLEPNGYRPVRKSEHSGVRVCYHRWFTDRDEAISRAQSWAHNIGIEYRESDQ